MLTDSLYQKPPSDGSAPTATCECSRSPLSFHIKKMTIFSGIWSGQSFSAHISQISQLSSPIISSESSPSQTLPSSLTQAKTEYCSQWPLGLNQTLPRTTWHAQWVILSGTPRPFDLDFSTNSWDKLQAPFSWAYSCTPSSISKCYWPYQNCLWSLSWIQRAKFYHWERWESLLSFMAHYLLIMKVTGWTTWRFIRKGIRGRSTHRWLTLMSLRIVTWLKGTFRPCSDRTCRSFFVIVRLI